MSFLHKKQQFWGMKNKEIVTKKRRTTNMRLKKIIYILSGKFTNICIDKKL